MSEYMVERHRWQDWPEAVVVCRDQEGEQRERRRYVHERTCFDISGSHVFACSNCDAQDHDYKNPSYCHGCGARVVEP